MEAQRSTPLGYLRLAAVYALVAWLAWSSDPSPATFWIGLGLVLPGEAIRFWAAGHLLKSAELVTAGPYAYTQNPLYLGRLLIFSGFCLMASLPARANLIVLGAGLAVFFGYYIPRKIRVEGQRLAERHGEAWAEYHRAMPILFPRLTPYPKRVAAPWRMERMLRNREHLMVAGVALVSLFFGLKAYAWL
jgi:protein-S-isoprenylcysteine O-methyltransferase Ste14